MILIFNLPPGRGSFHYLSTSSLNTHCQTSHLNQAPSSVALRQQLPAGPLVHCEGWHAGLWALFGPIPVSVKFSWDTVRLVYILSVAAFEFGGRAEEFQQRQPGTGTQRLRLEDGENISRASPHLPASLTVFHTCPIILHIKEIVSLGVFLLHLWHFNYFT